MVVAHRLRGPAVVLDELNLSTECTHVGNCALSLVWAIVPRSPELQLEYAEKKPSFTRLSAYQPTARTLFLARTCPEGMGPSQTKVTTTYSRSRRTLSLCRVGHPDLVIQ